MTEAEWLACTDLKAMVTFLRDRDAQQAGLSCACCWVRCRTGRGFCPAYRKLRLFSGACCCRILDLLPDPVCRQAVRSLEDYIEGRMELASYLRTYEEFDQTRRARFQKARTADDMAWNTLYGAVHRRWLEHFDDILVEERWLIALVVAMNAADPMGVEQARAHADLLRDVFNPFQTGVIDTSWLAWNDGTVVKLAHTIYADRAFDGMPILADALEDAGCQDAEILGHCRQQGVHARGCWVIDALTGRS
jgi:hypothetical protein